MKQAVCWLWVVLAAAPAIWLVQCGSASGLVLAPLADPAWRQALLRALAQAALASMLALPLAWPAALAFARTGFCGRRAGMRLLWWARLCPPVLLAVPLAALARDAVALPAAVRGAVAHLVFTVPTAVWILGLGFRRVPRALVQEAAQDDLTPLQRAHVLWWPASRASVVLAFLVGFAASFTEAALTGAVLGPEALAAALPAGGALPWRAAAALSALLPAAAWAMVLAWWWMRTGPRPARSTGPA
jgi:glycerol transport system permease protein